VENLQAAAAVGFYRCNQAPIQVKTNRKNGEKY
jgi:hypothetical protein